YGLRIDLKFDAGVHVVLAHRLDVLGHQVKGWDAAVADGAGPDVASGQIIHVGVGEEAEYIRRIDRTVIDPPNVAAEGTAGEFILHPIEVTAPASIQFYAAIAKEVVACAQTGSDLVAESELEAVFFDIAAEGRNLLVFNTDTEVQAQPACDSPSVLKE